MCARGSIFTGYYATDNAGSPGTWAEQGEMMIEIPEEVYMGLCVTSHSAGVLCTAVLDNVMAVSEIPSDLEQKMPAVNA